MRRKRVLSRAASVLLALVLWQAAAWTVGTELLLASPVRVLARLWELWLTADFWKTLLFTLSRIAAGFLLAFALGLLAALAAGRWPAVETLLWPYVTAIKTVPVASFIILCLIWLNSARLSVFISFLMAFPVLYSNVLEGLRNTDAKLLEMAALYRVSPWKRLVFLELPQIRPYLLSACSVALGLSWKAGIAAEVIGVVDGSMGERLYQSKIYFLTADLFAWTVMIVLMSMAFEKLVLWLLRRGFGGLEKR